MGTGQRVCAAPPRRAGASQSAGPRLSPRSCLAVGRAEPAPEAESRQGTWGPCCHPCPLLDGRARGLDEALGAAGNQDAAALRLVCLGW